VTIRGQVADRRGGRLVEIDRRRPPRRVRERAGGRPDRVAMWAVLLGVLLVLAAATSSHAAVRAPLKLLPGSTAAHAVPLAATALTRPRH
jgi:hypothetical protein